MYCICFNIHQQHNKSDWKLKPSNIYEEQHNTTGKNIEAGPGFRPNCHSKHLCYLCLFHSKHRDFDHCSRANQFPSRSSLAKLARSNGVSHLQLGKGGKSIIPMESEIGLEYFWYFFPKYPNYTLRIQSPNVKWWMRWSRREQGYPNKVMITKPGQETLAVFPLFTFLLFFAPWTTSIWCFDIIGSIRPLYIYLPPF